MSLNVRYIAKSAIVYFLAMYLAGLVIAFFMCLIWLFRYLFIGNASKFIPWVTEFIFVIAIAAAAFSVLCVLYFAVKREKDPKIENNSIWAAVFLTLKYIIDLNKNPFKS